MSTPPPPRDTREALVAAGLRLFGRQGFAATSVRQLAQEAEANVAAIAYHFGGKEGLRLACAQEFGRRMAGAVGTPHTGAGSGPDAARQELRTIVTNILRFLLGDAGASDIVPFMLRELAEGGPGIDAAYESFAEPVHRRLCGLWGQATATDPESPEVRLTVFSLIGQIMYFRIGQAIVLRRMGWPSLGQDETEQITRRILHNLDTLLAQGGTG